MLAITYAMKRKIIKVAKWGTPKNIFKKILNGAQLFVKYVEIFFSQFNNFSLLISNNRFQGQPIYFKLKKNTYL